jgi:transposase
VRERGDPVARIDVTPDRLHALLAQLRPKTTAEEQQALEALVETLLALAALLAQKRASIARLRRLLFGPRTEKTHAVLTHAGFGAEPPPPTDGPRSSIDEPAPPGRRRPGHGRYGASAYTGADRITMAHPQLKSGDRCPSCASGRVYVQRDPRVLVRFVGQAPIGATVYALERLRCHLCDALFSAPAPDGVGPEKHDATTGAMIAALKYGRGMPFNRLAQLQAGLGVPLPASTQWEIVAAVAVRIQAIWPELIRQAAQGEVLYNDDTTMRVLSLIKPTGARPPALPAATLALGDADVAPDRTGVFTSGIVATCDGHRIALFFTGRRHAGENLTQVLAQREPDLGPPIQMCDALARNVPTAFATILANCLSHARRNVVDVAPQFPDACRYVLETLRDVYTTEADAQQQRLSAEARLALHQRQSGPRMEALHAWCRAQLDEHLVEPNSGLGEALRYFLKHWTKLTRFLAVAGAPLDSNLVERALKKAILHRKGALFYKTENGARVGDLYMSVIHTCELNGVNAFDYLVELQRHADALKDAPTAWLPWTYRDTLEKVAASPAA